MRFFAGLIVGMMVLAAVAGTVSGADEEDTCAVLIYFGDAGNGRYIWADVPVKEGMSGLDALVNATDMLGLDLVYKDSEYGIWVESIGGPEANVANHWWGILTWDDADGSWIPASSGVSGISMGSGDAIALSFTSFSSMEPNAPTVSPDHRYPWTSFRHDPMNTGMQEMTSIKLSDLNWSKELEKGFISSSVVGANGFVYLFDGGDMFAADATSNLFCLDAAGNIIWKQEIEKSAYQITSPLLYQDMVIVSTADGYVYAFNATRGGEEEWKFDTESRTIGFDSGMTSSPAAYQDNIIVAASNGKVFSINASDGSGKELFDVDAKIYSSSPAIYAGIIYIGDESGRVWAYDIESGQEVWHKGIGTGKVRASPLVDTAKGQVIVTSAFDSEGDKGGKISALKLTSGDIVWQSDIGGTSASATLSSKGYVVTTATDIIMFDFDGKRLWIHDIGDTFGGGAATVLGDKIFTVTNEESSRLISIDMNGRLVDEVVLEPAEYTLCSPTFIDGLLFVTSNNGHVYAFSVVEDVRNDEDGNLWLLVGGIAAIVLIAAVGLMYWNGKRKGEQ